VRLFELSDFQQMFKDAGLTLEQTFGSYVGVPFEQELSPRLIMFAKR
jgi:hypothetical protein